MLGWTEASQIEWKYCKQKNPQTLLTQCLLCEMVYSVNWRPEGHSGNGMLSKIIWLAKK